MVKYDAAAIILAIPGISWHMRFDDSAKRYYAEVTTPEGLELTSRLYDDMDACWDDVLEQWTAERQAIGTGSPWSKTPLLMQSVQNIVAMLALVLGGLFAAPGCGDGRNDDEPSAVPVLVSTRDAIYEKTEVVGAGFYYAQAYLTNESPVLKVRFPLQSDGAHAVVVTLRNREPDDAAHFVVTAIGDGRPTPGDEFGSGSHSIDVSARSEIVVEVSLATPGAIFSGDFSVAVLP